MSPANHGHSGSAQPVRCAVYTRKSTTEGLDSDFNTLDAQREAAEHYIRSQTAAGWTVLPERYDDGGFTGGNLERPALQRLLDDIDRGRVDMVVVYKIDRLSRSILDFARLMERFERRHVAFVAITQHFDTSTSMGRLMVNVLLSFAQFEREIISERTRDKIQAARRRGKWTGGHLVLGYGLDPAKRGLVVIEDEAKVVRLVFELYLKSRSIDAVAEQLNAMGHVQKRYATRSGKARGGGRWNRNAVYLVLRNPLYVGRVRSKGGQLNVAEHEAIVDLAIFEVAAASLADRTTGKTRRSRVQDYLLAGIVRCGPCGAAMWPSGARGGRGREYRYYRCRRHQEKAGRCPTGLIPAERIEKAVVAQVAQVAQRADVRQRVLDRVRVDTRGVGELRATRDGLDSQLAERTAEAKRLLTALSGGAEGGKLMAGRLGELESEIDMLRSQSSEVDGHLRALADATAKAERVAELLDCFEAVWDVLVPAERSEIVRLVVRQVMAARTGLRVTFHDLPLDMAVQQAVAV